MSKRLASRYVSGPSRSWIKSKCANWRRANVNRGKLFERPQKPALTEGQRTLVKKWVELAQVQEQLRDHDLRPDVAHELRKRATSLGQKIAEPEGKG